ncbi:MAG: glycosyltransferase [Candidatus Hydrogenedentes bacterium]|nr:glycosyltransferase [Candidatus Hydrogenedentota bacterium]
MATPRILTFNFHEPYLCMMAAAGLPMDVGVYEHGVLARQWHTLFRPAPESLTGIREAEWRSRVASGYYDVIIAQNENNALDLYKSRSPKLLLCHNRRTFLSTTANVNGMDAPELFERMLDFLKEHFTFLFISESKRDDYGVPGRVILPGIDVEAWGGYRGDVAQVLRVGNTMRQRNLMFDVDLQEAAVKGLASKVVGVNPEIPGSEAAPSFEALQEDYRASRCYLHVSREAFEDGYNLAMLEALATGTPVVSLSNPTSPLTHGADGFLSYDAAELNGYCRALLEDRDLARRIGAQGRETVAAKFPMDRFVAGWCEAIEEAASQSTRLGKHRKAPGPARPCAVVTYVKSPLTTGNYLEAAAREHFDVITAGFRVPERVLNMWGFVSAPPPYPPHDYNVSMKCSYKELWAKFPEDRNPDYLFWIDSGLEAVQPDLDWVPVPTAAYIIDTHVNTGLRIEIARHFDHVFIAQKAQLDLFREAGIPQAQWVPLGCSPALHNVGARERIYDVAFAGSALGADGDWRKELLLGVKAQFPNNKMGQCWPGEMAEWYAQARIVINASHKNDVNMRVFEAMASGALLITDNVAGLTDLFEPGTHLVMYDNPEEVPGLIAHYLEYEDERLAIAAAGQREVLEKHTYARRVGQIFDAVKAAEARNPKRRAEKPQVHHEVKEESYYQNLRPEIFPYVPMRTRRLLDVGCGAGVMARAIKQQRNLEEASGIEYIEEAYNKALRVLDRVWLGSIEDRDPPFEEGHFDCIICADVLEHLVEPEAALRRLARFLAPDGVIAVSIPNVQFHDVLHLLSEGLWDYMDAGILDATHLRFFTRSALRTMVEAAGLELATIRPLNARPASHFPANPDGSVVLGKIRLEHATAEEYENFLVYQYALQIVKPGVDRLAHARAALEMKDNEVAIALALDAVGVDECERHALVATCLARQGKLDTAAENYEKALAIRADARVGGEYGILLVGMNRGALARPWLERAVAAHPDFERAQGALGLLCMAENDPDGAYDHFYRALSDSYDQKILIPHFVTMALNLHREEEALPVVQGYCDFFQSNPELACSLARLLHAIGRVEDACDVLDNLLLLLPDAEEARALLAEMRRH